MEIRRERAKALMDLDRTVIEKVEALKAKGLTSPYLKSFVVARINPIRFQKGGNPEFDETIAKMLASARKFKAEGVKPEQLARAGGAPDE